MGSTEWGVKKARGRVEENYFPKGREKAIF